MGFFLSATYKRLCFTAATIEFILQQKKTMIASVVSLKAFKASSKLKLLFPYYKSFRVLRIY